MTMAALWVQALPPEPDQNKMFRANPGRREMPNRDSPPVVYFYARLEKGVILFCNCRSVGRSVCRRLDLALILLKHTLFTFENDKHFLTYDSNIFSRADNQIMTS